MNDVPTRSSRLFWPAVLAIGLAFFATEHDLGASLREGFSSTADELEAAAGGGNSLRRAAFAGLGGVGVLLLVLPASVRQEGRSRLADARTDWQSVLPGRLRLNTLRALPLVLFVVWCGASVLWSDDAEMTLRRLSVFACFAVAALGVARQFTARDLVRAVLVVSAAYLVLGVAVEVRNGTFQPWSGEFRFAGTLHPNTQGLNLTLLCLSSLCLGWTAPRRRWLLLSLFVVAFAFLVLTKSRASVAGLLAALGLAWTINTPLAWKAGAGAAAGWLLACAALVMLLGGIDAGRDVAPLVLLGRADEAGSLTGRIPLWSELSGWAGDRLLCGYGFDSFWTADRIDAVSTEMQWGIHEAHSSYLDLVLSVGLIGAGLLLAGVLAAVGRAARLLRTTGRPEFAFLFGWLAFCLLNGLTESTLTMPAYAMFVAAAGIAGLLFKPHPALAKLRPAAELESGGASPFAGAAAAPAHPSTLGSCS